MGNARQFSALFFNFNLVLVLVLGACDTGDDNPSDDDIAGDDDTGDDDDATADDDDITGDDDTTYEDFIFEPMEPLPEFETVEIVNSCEGRCFLVAVAVAGSFPAIICDEQIVWYQDFADCDGVHPEAGVDVRTIWREGHRYPNVTVGAGTPYLKYPQSEVDLRGEKVWESRMEEEDYGFPHHQFHPLPGGGYAGMVLNARDAELWETDYVRFYDGDSFEDVIEVDIDDWGNNIFPTDDTVYYINRYFGVTKTRKFQKNPSTGEWDDVWDEPLVNWGTEGQGIGHGHAATRLDDGDWLTFNNEPETKAVRLSLDESTGVGHVVWEEMWADHRQEGDLEMIPQFGNVELMDDGNYLVNWGWIGSFRAQVDVVTEDHETVCSLTMSPVHTFYVVRPFPIYLLGELEE
ncbi:MAG: hypothetical protein ABIG66_00760 [Candidatus Kerfeldbacteria bacterium]